MATSIVLVTRIVAAADQSVRVWALARDVAAGTTLADADLRPARVRLFDSAPAYLQVNASPAGRVASRSLRAGELLPVSALSDRPPGVIVSIPVKPENAPAVARGQLIDVWSTTKGCPPVRVLGRVAVQEVRLNGGGALSVSSGALHLTVRVGADQAERVIAALGAEATIRIVVVEGPAAAGRPGAGLAGGCVSAGTPSGFRAAPAAGPAGRVAAAGVGSGGSGGSGRPAVATVRPDRAARTHPAAAAVGSGGRR